MAGGRDGNDRSTDDASIAAFPQLGIALRQCLAGAPGADMAVGGSATVVGTDGRGCEGLTRGRSRPFEIKFRPGGNFVEIRTGVRAVYNGALVTMSR